MCYLSRKGTGMKMTTNIEYVLQRFPRLAKLFGVSTHTQYQIPCVSDGVRNQFTALCQAANLADQTWNDVIKAHYGSQFTYTPDEIDKACLEHPELITPYNYRHQKHQELQDFCMKHPEIWRPGQDVAWFYDADTLQNQMSYIAYVDREYIKELIERCSILTDELNKAKKGSDTTELLNKLEFATDLLQDAYRTIGDKCCEIWWKAIPDVIKHTYAKTMNDAMIQLLAENDELTDYVLHFRHKITDIKKCKKFLKLLEHGMNQRLSMGDKPVKYFLATKDDFSCSAFYDREEIKIVIGLDCFKYGVDYVIDTIKHEYLGHHIDNTNPNYGLVGESMANFIKQNFDELQTHGGGRKWDLELRSPLLKTRYAIDDVPKESLDILQKQGWQVIKVPDRFEIEKYRNRFEEQAAWLVGETYDTVNQVIAYRYKHGISNPAKTK